MGWQNDPGKNYADLSAWPGPLERELEFWRYAKARYESLPSYLSLGLHGQTGAVKKTRYECRFVLPPTLMMAQYRWSDSLVDIPIAHLRRWASLVKYI